MDAMNENYARAQEYLPGGAALGAIHIPAKATETAQAYATLAVADMLSSLLQLLGQSKTTGA